MRTLWYALHILMHNPDTQKNGYIRLANLAETGLVWIDPRFPFQLSQLTKAFPVNLKAEHICNANAVTPLVRQTINALFYILPKTQGKPGIFLHNGPEEGVLQSLSEHEIPKQCIPTEMGERMNFLSKAHLFNSISNEMMYYSKLILGGTLKVDFFQNRLAIEGALEPPIEKCARNLSPSCTDVNGLDHTPPEKVPWGINSNDAGFEAADTAKSHNTPPPEDNQIDVLAHMWYPADPAESPFFFPLAPVQAEDVNEMAHHAISFDEKATVSAASIRALKGKLARVPHDESSAIIHVQQSAPSLVDDDHLLIFLRAEGFDVDVSV